MSHEKVPTLLQQWKRGLRLYAVVTLAVMVLYLPVILIVAILQFINLDSSESIVFAAWLILMPVFGLLLGPIVIYRVAKFFEVSVSEEWRGRPQEVK